MLLSARQLGPGELDHELIWLSVSTGTVALAGVWLALGLPWPYCVFHALTGYPCLTCGATRAAMQFFHGHFLASLRWNPLAFAALCALFLFNVYAAVVLVARAPRLRFSGFTATQKNLVRVAVLTVLGLNWVYLLMHSAQF
jgi:hypothetical protein